MTAPRIAKILSDIDALAAELTPEESGGGVMFRTVPEAAKKRRHRTGSATVIVSTLYEKRCKDGRSTNC
jgi:hypothetical protein